MNSKTLLATMLLAAVLCPLDADFTLASGGQNQAKKEKKMQTITKDIVDTASSAGNFSTLVTALKQAGLVETLKGSGPFTVFAPSDDAFKKIPEKDLQAILADKDKLTKILTYHVVAGQMKAADVVKQKSAKTVEGSEVSITVSGNEVKVDGAKVTSTDIMCSNGVVHVIDTVIIPKN